MANDRSPLPSETQTTNAEFAVGPGSLLVNRYEIREYIGKGGMGLVFKAYDRTLDDTVAIKVLQPQFFADDFTRQRFLGEIKLARRVTHRNVCRLHDFGEAGPLRFISMQFVDGVELRTLIRQRGGLSAAEGFEIALQMVDGLECIHEAGIIHRDLKTSNVMIDRRGSALVMDFGIAKRLDAPDVTLTGAGQIVGTPEYMSPEQAKGEPIDLRTDIYSLGVVLFELFTGTTPFGGGNFAQMLYKKLREPVFDSVHARQIPVALLPVITKSLSTKPEDRFSSARELKAALLAARGDAQLGTSDTTHSLAAKVRDSGSHEDAGKRGEREPGVSQRHRRPLRAVTIAAVAVTVVLLAALWIVWSLSDSTRTSQRPLPTPGDSQFPEPPRPATTTVGAAAAAASPTPAAPPAPAAPTSGSCEAGDAADCVRAGRAAELRGDFQTAANRYRAACDGRAAAGCTALGVLYNRALGVTRDATQAALFYERGCQGGDMAGCNNLGTLYQFGSAGFRDAARAMELYELACSKGEMDGCANLGLLLAQTGLGTDQRRARELLNRACAAGISRACGVSR